MYKIFCLFAFLSCFSCQNMSEKPKIVALYNLTGNQAELDSYSAQGAKLAFEDHPEVSLLLVNGKSDPEWLHKTAETLSKDKKIIAFFGLSDTDMVLAAAPPIVAKHKVFLTSGATSPLLPEKIPNYLYLLPFGDNTQAAASAEYAIKDLHLKTACIIYDNYMEYARLLGVFFRNSFTHLGGNVVLMKSFSSVKDVNFIKMFQEMKEFSPSIDLIYIASGPEKAFSLLKEIRENGFTQPVFAGDSWDLDVWTNAKPNFVIGPLYFSTHVFLDKNSPDPEIREFMRAYERKYKMNPTAFAALGYDAANLLLDAIRRARSYQKEKIDEALAATKDFVGVTGKIHYKTDQKVSEKPVSIVVVDEKGKRLAKKFIPEYVPEL